jgi:N-acetylglucosamine malate deacetylase 1
MKTLLVVAPHADDESLGCAGTILRYRDEGASIHWLLVTGMTNQPDFNDEQISTRDEEIKKVQKKYKFDSVTRLDFPPAALDTVPLLSIIKAISLSVENIAPDIVFTPYRNDAHSDHKIVFDAVMSASKSFRYPFIKRGLAYETISETDFGMKPEDGGFRPNIYIDISNYLEEKLDILEIFQSEMGEFPFPRSRKAISALANLRGAQCNAHSAEAFMLIKEII